MLVQQGRCPECSGTEFVTDMETGEIACSQCGLVLQEEILDQKPEWRAFTPEETRSKARTGPPASLRQFDKGLSTTFQPYKDTYGRSLPMRERLKMMRLRKWNIRARVHSSAERNLSQAMNELTRLSDKLHIPASVEENAALIYRKALDEGLIRGRSIKSIAAAALYIACVQQDEKKTQKELAEAAGVTEVTVRNRYKILKRQIELSDLNQ